MELEQRKIIYGSRSLESKQAARQKATALLADEPYFGDQELIDYGQNDYSSAKSNYSSVKSEYTQTKPKIIEAEIDEVSMDLEDDSILQMSLNNQKISQWLIWMQGSSTSNSERTPGTRKHLESSSKAKEVISGSNSGSRSSNYNKKFIQRAR